MNDDTTNDPIDITLDGTEFITTFGGEAYIDDDIMFAKYGLSFGKVAIYDITPDQMARLACEIANHLILCGHSFEVRKTYEQDQRERLVCLTDFSKNNG
jgi:hypothetical protein